MLARVQIGRRRQTRLRIRPLKAALKLSAQISSEALRVSFEPMFCRPKHILIDELWLAQNLRQLGDVGRDPPRLIAREQLERMSAFPPIADIASGQSDVRFGSKADMAL